MKRYYVAKCPYTRSFFQQVKIMSATARKTWQKNCQKQCTCTWMDRYREFICKRAKVRNIKLGVDKSIWEHMHSRKQVYK